MYQGHSIIEIQPCYCESKITVVANFDIDPESVNDSTVQLFSKNDGVNVNLDLIVDRKSIVINIKNEIVPNTDYILRVFNIKGLLGEDLTAGIRRKLVFASEIREVPLIMTPSDYEEVKDLKVVLTTLKESDEVEQIEDKMFFIQIATDVAFYDVVMETYSNKSETNLKDLIAGQYYMRARVEKVNDGKKDFGKWSESITFISLNFHLNEPGTPPEEEDTEPEYIEYVSIVDSPVNGETPETILIEFSGDINPDSIEEILVIRRDI